MATVRTFANMLNEKSLFRRPKMEQKKKSEAKSLFLDKTNHPSSDDEFTKSDNPAKIVGVN